MLGRTRRPPIFPTEQAYPMRILELKAMRGPNSWSVRRHHLIVMRLDIEDLEQRPTDKIPGFYERITTMLPTMGFMRCIRVRKARF